MIYLLPGISPMTGYVAKYTRHEKHVAFTSCKGIEHYAILTVMTYGLARMHKVPKEVAEFKMYEVQISAFILINKGSSFHISAVNFDVFNA